MRQLGQPSMPFVTWSILTLSLRESTIAASALLTPNHPAGTSQWVYTTPCFGSTNLTLTINRGFPTCNLLMASYGTPPLTNAYIPCTQVSIQYPYQWHFNSVITLIVPGASYGPFITIQTDATATNVE